MRILLVLIALLTVPGQAAAQAAAPTASQTGIVTGYLWTASNTPIADAKVQLRQVSTGVVAATARTATDGAFTFDGVRPDRYVIEYARNTQPPSILAVGHPFTLAPGETVSTFVRTSNALPVLIADASPMTVSAAVGWAQDMTQDNKRMSGGTIEAAFPIRRGAWIAVEGGFFRSVYPHPVFEPSSVRRVTFQVSGRVGSPNRRGLFAQSSVGFWRQTLNLKGLGGSGATSKFRTDNPIFTVGSAVGVDVPVGTRFSLVILAELQMIPQHPRDRWVHPKISAGMTFRIPRR